MTSPDTLEWTDDFALGLAPMDATHREFVHCVDTLLRSEDAQLRAALEAFAEHAEQHFAQENRWMADSAYENARCHVDEHHAVLASVREVLALPAERFMETGRRLARELARWFPGHTEVMDQGLALHLAKQRFGGAPIKLQRRAGP